MDPIFESETSIVLKGAFFREERGIEEGVDDWELGSIEETLGKACARWNLIYSAIHCMWCVKFVKFKYNYYY